MIGWLKYLPWLFFWVKYFPKSKGTYKALARVKDIIYDPINTTSNLVAAILEKTGPLIQRGAAIVALVVAALVGADVGVDYGRKYPIESSPIIATSPPPVETIKKDLEEVEVIEEVEEIEQPKLIEPIEAPKKEDVVEDKGEPSERGKEPLKANKEERKITRKVVKRIEWRPKRIPKDKKAIYEPFTINSSGVNGY